MENGQFPISQDDKKWDRPWTTDEIRRNSSNWTLAGDVGLYNTLVEFSQNILSRSHEVGNSLDNLVHKTKMASVKINNTINDFHMLSNLQFVENRVYDEELQDNTIQTKPVEKTKEQKEAEMIPKIVQAVELGLKVLDQAFNRINVNEISDSEEEDLSSESRTILEPKDPYDHRPLPFIIGSDEFQKCDFAGLKDLIEEDVEPSVEVESSVSDTDETSSDEEELPLDEDKFDGPNKRPPSQTISDQLSSSDESELFGSEQPENGYLSDSSLGSKVKEGKNIQRLNEEIKVAVKEQRQDSVSSMQSKLNLPQVLPMPKKIEKKKESEDLFAKDDELSDDDSPFRKKTGLFSTDVRFGDDEDMFEGGLFNNSPKDIKKVESPKTAPSKPAPVASKKKDEPSLFSNDEESDEDIFNTLMRTKAPAAKKDNTSSYKKLGTALPGLTGSKNNSIFGEDENSDLEVKKSPDKTDSSSTTPSSAPSSKPSAGGFDFGVGGGPSGSLFGDESDPDDLFSTKKLTSKGFDFAAVEDDEDDLFGVTGNKTTKKLNVAEIKKEVSDKSSLFEESEEIIKPAKQKGLPLPGMTSTKKEDSLFKDNSPEKPPQKSYQKLGTALPGLTNKKKDSMFEDTDASDQEEISKKSTADKKIQSAAIPKIDTTISFFDDEDDDMFGQGPRQLLSPGKSPSMKTHSETLSSESKEEEAKSVISSKTNKIIETKGLFDEDDNDIDFTQGLKKDSLLPSVNKNHSIFEESDNFDLFTPKPLEKSAPIQEVPVFTTKEASPASLDVIPNGQILKTRETVSPVNESVSEVPSGFDIPIESTKTLHVINKDRARITAKRRKPTRKGRIAALESNSSDNQPDAAMPNNIRSSTSGDDEVFTASSNKSQHAASSEPVAKTPPTSNHKVQEKKKMDLMSQLMSEAASKRKKPPVQEDEEEVDIFSEVARKDKSQSFSFHSPIESVPTLDSKVEDKPVSSADDTVEDDDNDEFFAEPSFQNFRSSISHKDSILDLDDDDDLFSTVKTTGLPKPKLETSDNDIFGDESDIFADIQKEKYEMFPSQLYDEDDDIFGSLDQSTSNKSSVPAKATNSVPVKKEVEKKPVFDDPLSGLLGDD